MILWLIDDTLQHHDTAEATALLVPGVTFTGFITGEEALEAFREAGNITQRIPDAILMDYYIGDERGDQVTEQFRRVEPASKRPVIIGYSSLTTGSTAIIEAGADLMLRKQRNDEGINPALLDWLQRAVG